MRASYSRGIPEHDELYPYSISPQYNGRGWILQNLITSAVLGANFPSYAHARLAADAELARIAGVCDACE